MRFVFTLVLGVVAGYVLHNKRDETIDSIAQSVTKTVTGFISQKG